MNTGLGGRNTDDSLYGGSFGIVAAAHELKSPVALMRQLALGLEALGEVNSKQQDYIQRIVLTSERSLRLTENLTCANSSNIELFATEPVNVQQLCEEVAHELQPLYRAYGRKIAVKKRRQAPLAIANRDLLRRILLGFGDNALHYAGSNGALFNLLQIKNKIRIGLRDFGPTLVGLDEQAHRQQQRVYRPESSGLGLVIAEQFASAMNGQIGAVRHCDGMTYYVDVMQSEQLCLF